MESRMMTKSNGPLISVVLPVRNEEKYIRRCLDSIVDQTIQKELIEVLVIDGNSTDSTPEIVKLYSKRYSFIKLINNPRQDTISGLNLGINMALGEIIIRVDGHTYLEKDYIEKCIEALSRTGADNVGGPMRPVGETYIQKAIALATRSIFGIGWGKFHYSNKEEYVDTVYLGAYRRSIFDKIGIFDPDMHYSEDNEFNMRIILNGGRILLSPQIKSFYFPRESLRELWKQYFRYGYYKLKVLRKHKVNISTRHYIPALFVGGLIFSLALSPFVSFFRYLLCILICSYLVASVIFSLNLSYKNGFEYLPVLPVVFAVLHCSYGFGFIKGIFDFLLLKKEKRKDL